MEKHRQQRLKSSKTSLFIISSKWRLIVWTTIRCLEWIIGFVSSILSLLYAWRWNLWIDFEILHYIKISLFDLAAFILFQEQDNQSIIFIIVICTVWTDYFMLKTRYWSFMFCIQTKIIVIDQKYYLLILTLLTWIRFLWQFWLFIFNISHSSWTDFWRGWMYMKTIKWNDLSSWTNYQNWLLMLAAWI